MHLLQAAIWRKEDVECNYMAKDYEFDVAFKKSFWLMPHKAKNSCIKSSLTDWLIWGYQRAEHMSC